MKKLLSLILALIIVIGMLQIPVFAAYQTGSYRVSVSDGLNLRSSANTSSTVLVAIPYNTTLNVTEISGSWGKTTFSGCTGWIFLDYATYIETSGDGEYAIFPADILAVTQGAYGEYNSFSHNGQGGYYQNAFDLSCDSQNYFAPFSGTITEIKEYFNAIVLQSDAPVHWANGDYDYMSVVFSHDNDISDLWIGKHISQGDVFYQPGVKGGASGSHVHLCVNKGKTNDGIVWLSGDTRPNEAFFVAPDTTIRKTGNYTWVELPENISTKTYTISYNANGSEGAPSSQTKSHDIAITLSSATPIREGYTFQGWATSANGNVVYTPGDNYTANSSITLYAVWDDNKNWSNWSDWDDEVITSSDYRQVQTKNVYVYYHYILTYSSNGQSGAYAIEKDKMNALYPSDPANTQNYHTYYSDTKLSQVDSFTYYGKTYRAYKNLCPQDSSYTFGDNAYHLYDDGIDTTKTLYRYRDIQYNIEYEANGGTGAPAAQTKTHGTALALSSTTPTRTGYTFKGWATTASGSVSYAPGASFTTNADTILYAVWKSNTVSVTGVTLNKTAETLTVGDTLTLTAIVAPSNATNKNVTWTSSNTSVATVSNGVVTAKAAGTATITVKTADGDKIATCAVTVTKAQNVDGSAKLKIGDVTGAQGQTVRVPITLPDNPGIAGLEFTLQFDASALEIVDIEYDNWGGSDNKEQVRPENELSFSFHSAGNYTKEALCTLVFKVKDDAKTGEYSLKIIYSFACNEDLLDIELAITTGAVEILDFIIGDSDGDGKINTKDVVLIAQCIAGWNVTINTAAIDCSGDGILNTKDVVLLAQYIAGWDVKLG